MRFKILKYNETGNNILSISFMFDAHEEQYSKKDRHIQQDVVSQKRFKTLTYNETKNNILSISFMFNAHEEQYSKRYLHIQQDVVSIIKMI